MSNTHEEAVPAGRLDLDDGVESEVTDPALVGDETDSTDDAVIQRPFDPEKISIFTKPTTVDLVLTRLEYKEIDRQPDFQRAAGIWSDTKQSRLIESLLLRIPLPIFYAAEHKDESWAIIDGVQRLTTIARFIRPYLVPESRPLVLSDLQYLKDFNGKTFEDLPHALQRRARETELLFHIIRASTPDEVKYNIFARLNTGGEPLTQQELRHALTPGPIRDILREWAASEEFRRATAESVRSKRMADREMVLRFLAFSRIDTESYRTRDLDEFLREAMNELNRADEEELAELWLAFAKAMTYSYKIFEQDAFRKRYRADEGRKLVNKALFEAVSVNLSRLNDTELERLVERKSEVRDEFMNLMNRADFDRSISQGTGDPRKVKVRFEALRQLFGEHSC